MLQLLCVSALPAWNQKKASNFIVLAFLSVLE